MDYLSYACLFKFTWCTITDKLCLDPQKIKGWTNQISPIYIKDIYDRPCCLIIPDRLKRYIIGKVKEGLWNRTHKNGSNTPRLTSPISGLPPGFAVILPSIWPSMASYCGSRSSRMFSVLTFGFSSSKCQPKLYDKESVTLSIVDGISSHKNSQQVALRSRKSSFHAKYQFNYFFKTTMFKNGFQIL